MFLYDTLTLGRRIRLGGIKTVPTSSMKERRQVVAITDRIRMQMGME